MEKTREEVRVSCFVCIGFCLFVFGLLWGEKSGVLLRISR